MSGQIVEITEPGYSLKKSRGFLEVRSNGENLGQVVLDDIALVMVSVPGCTVSTNLLDHLARRNIPLVVCGENYLPTSWTLPVQEHGRQFQIMQSQMKLSEPRRKRFWQQIIKAKIANQAAVLERIGRPNQELVYLAKKVKSGDSDNCEAQAARTYWGKLFNQNFRRDRRALGLNSALNYAYTVLRACVARGVVGAGLHPSFSVHHKNPQNPFNLVDDLLEPFRPIADLLIHNKQDIYGGDLTLENKEPLASLPMIVLPVSEGVSPLSLVAVRLCRSFGQYCSEGAIECEMPCLPNPLDMA